MTPTRAEILRVNLPTLAKEQPIGSRRIETKKGGEVKKEQNERPHLTDDFYAKKRRRKGKSKIKQVRIRMKSFKRGSL